MEKVQMIDIDRMKTRVISKNHSSIIFELSDGSILKVFTTLVKKLYNVANINIENKIMSATKIEKVPEIIVPKCGVYNGNSFAGYIMDKAKGIDLNEYDDNLSMEQRSDLKVYAALFNVLESIMKRGHSEGIYFPDFCTCDNIFIDNGHISFIDYDGLQIGNNKAITLSTSLGENIQYENMPKYCKNGLFTEELDKKSLVILYFLSAFNINLNMIGVRTPSGDIVTLDDIFQILNINDYEFMHKVWKCLNDKELGEYIGEDIIRLAFEYDMKAMPYNGMYLKRLERKRKV